MNRRLITLDSPAAMGGFMALFVALWAAASYLTHLSLGLDTLEGLVWGREWLLGTNKHPTLPAWALEIFWRLFGDSGTYIILPLFHMATLGVIYTFARAFMSSERAQVAALFAVFCFSLRSFENVFNHNTAQPLFWVSVAYLFYVALRDQKLLVWLGLGVVGAACFWTKYSGIFLLVCIPLWLLIDRQARATLKTAGPWASLAVFLILISPHIYFLFESNFLPLKYGQVRALGGHNVFIFVLQQVLFQLPAIAILLAAGVSARIRTDEAYTKEDKFILAFAFAPLLLCVAVMGLFFFSYGLRTNWSYSFLPLVGLALMRWLPAQPEAQEKKATLRATTIFAVLLLLIPIAHGVGLMARPHLGFSAPKLSFPQKALGQKVARHFAKASGNKTPLLFVGRLDEAGRAAIEHPARPPLLLYGDWEKNPWLSQSGKCQATAIIWLKGNFLPAYNDLLNQCGVKNKKPIRIRVKQPHYPHLPPIEIRMIVITN